MSWGQQSTSSRDLPSSSQDRWLPCSILGECFSRGFLLVKLDKGKHFGMIEIRSKLGLSTKKDPGRVHSACFMCGSGWVLRPIVKHWSWSICTSIKSRRMSVTVARLTWLLSLRPFLLWHLYLLLFTVLSERRQVWRGDKDSYWQTQGGELRKGDSITLQ